jgi:hypothetical protein
MYINCSSSIHQKNKVTFKITIWRVIDQMVILKATSFFDGHLDLLLKVTCVS